MSDLTEGQTQPASAAHESQQAQDVGGVRAIAGRRAARHRKDAARLVQPKRLRLSPLRVATSPIRSPPPMRAGYSATRRSRSALR